MTGIIFAICTPLCANIEPIRNALGKNLRNSLDATRSNSQTGFSVIQQRLEDISLSPTEVIAGATLVILGFVTFYVVPMFMFAGEMAKTIVAMNSVLLVVLLGFGLISVLILPGVTKLIMKSMIRIVSTLCCQKEDLKLTAVIEMNLKAHETRNVKTGLMFVLVMAFLVFATNTLTCMIDLLDKYSFATIGADIQANSWFLGSSYLDEYNLSNYLD
jgi:hypothetical protein